MARRKTQAYTEEFRREALKRSEKEGNTTASVPRELGVSAQQNMQLATTIQSTIR